MTAANNNTTQPLPDQRVPVIDRYRRWSPSWWRFLKPLLESTNRNSERIEAVSDDLTTAQASITTEATVRATADAALASQISTVSAAYQAADASLSASITNEATARAAADTTIATQLSTVSTTVGQNTASIETLSQSVDGYAGRWSLSLNVNGRVTGAITLAGTQTQSAVAILADKFIIVNPGNNGDVKQAFIVGTVAGVSTVGINGNLIVDGTILARHIAANQISAIAIQANAISAEKIESNAIQARHLSVDSVTAEAMQANSIGAGEIQSSAILARHITASSISAAAIQTDAVTAEKIQSNAIQARHITANTITADKFAAGAITANTITTGTLRSVDNKSYWNLDTGDFVLGAP